MVNKDSKIIENVIAQAKFYLENAGEFYPFGTIIDKGNNIKPIGVFLGEEMPNSMDVLAQLEKGIQKGIKNGDYRTGAIGIDITLSTKPNSTSTKQDALEVRLYKETGHFTTFYFLYLKKDNVYDFEEYVE